MLTPKTLNHTDSSKAEHLTKNMNYLINSGINFGCYDIKKNSIWIRKYIIWSKHIEKNTTIILILLAKWFYCTITVIFTSYETKG